MCGQLSLYELRVRFTDGMGRQLHLCQHLPFHPSSWTAPSSAHSVRDEAPWTVIHYLSKALRHTPHYQGFLPNASKHCSPLSILSFIPFRTLSTQRHRSFILWLFNKQHWKTINNLLWTARRTHHHLASACIFRLYFLMCNELIYFLFIKKREAANKNCRLIYYHYS